MEKKEVCQACQKETATIVEAIDDPDYPYHLCGGCHSRLRAFSLKPIEWYRLAAMYSPEPYHLHDDFYDDDGKAAQPELKVKVGRLERSPKLKDVKGNLSELLDFVTTRWFLEEKVMESFTSYEPKEILAHIQKRYEETPFPDIKYRMIELAQVVGPVAEEWIRELWENTEDGYEYVVARVAPYCLPPDEAYEKALFTLKGIEEKSLPFEAYAVLSNFHFSQTLDFIETNCTVFDDQWGRLAAASNPTWDRMKSWLEKGRPLSLVALDTMANCGNREFSAVSLGYTPKISNTNPAEVEAVLVQYKEIDSVHRVKLRVASILENRNKIFE